jgi:hypothetical protein
MCPTFMVVDRQGGNIENSNIWKIAQYVPKDYKQHVIDHVVFHEALSCPSFL